MIWTVDVRRFRWRARGSYQTAAPAAAAAAGLNAKWPAADPQLSFNYSPLADLDHRTGGREAARFAEFVYSGSRQPAVVLFSAQPDWLQNHPRPAVTQARPVGSRPGEAAN
ncbi:hypothetical protein KCP78_25565 [Salmonella enterica subsp. enterica]|nr:hypothetical protein KCP78_25565 [Salmonella enterica subsp. enterica]